MEEIEETGPDSSSDSSSESDSGSVSDSDEGWSPILLSFAGRGAL